MRKIAEKDIDPDPKRIIDRCNELIRKWKCLLEAPTQEGSDEEASPKTVTHVEGESPHQEEPVHHEKSNLLLSYEQEIEEIESKKNEENVDNNMKEDKERFPSAMDIDEINDVQPETPDTADIGEGKQVVEDKDNIVTNGSSPAANNQEVNNHEKEDTKNKTLEL